MSDTGVSGPYCPEKLFMVVDMYVARGAYFGQDGAWDRFHKLGWYFTLNLQDENSIKASLSEFPRRTKIFAIKSNKLHKEPTLH